MLEGSLYTAAVGPVSSNWDRAVELYYYIKGGTVDYGAAHAKEHGHERFGRTFPGIYRQWSNKDKLHLVGHSMGGQTSRTLVQLLKHGSPDEIAHYKQHSKEGMSPLFKGGKSWVHSVSTIATPHNGSTFADENSLRPLINQIFLSAGSLTGTSSESIAYDFKLDQWGLKRKSGESFLQYADRVYNSRVWNNKDISLYDLTTHGAAELNDWVETQPDVYYFSYTGDATYKGLLSGHSYPMATMTPLFHAPSLFMGSYTRNSREPIIDKYWWPNDGLVNVVSSKYPFGHRQEPAGNQADKGEWNHFPVQRGWDHFDYIGINAADTVGYTNIYSFYDQIANNLKQLPK